MFKAGETITGQQAGGIDKLMDSSGRVLDKLEVVVDAFSNVFGDKNVQKSMREGFVQTGEVAKNMNDFTKALLSIILIFIANYFLSVILYVHGG